MIEKHKKFRKKNLLLMALTLSILSGCNPASKITVSSTKRAIVEPSKITITKIKIVNHQIIITGTNLNTVTNFKITEGSNNTNLQIESKNNTSIVANTISNVTFAAGRVFDFILSNANAASTFTVDFSLCDSTLGGKAIDCLIAPTNKQVLSYDSNSKSWRPRSVNGLSYKGVWSSLPTLPVVGSLVPGDYYIVGVAQGIYHVGDWIVLNDDGVTFEQIENSTAVESVFGRIGAIVGAENDYRLNLLGDVDIATDPPDPGDGLVYNGVKWVAGPVTSLGATGAAGGDLSGTYPNPTIGNNKILDAHIANSAISQTKINGLAASLAGKEPGITAAGTTTYYRGDKTFVTLNSTVVTEGTNLYFTNARALGLVLTGFNNTLTGQVAATDTMLQAFGRIQNQINSLSSGGSNYLIKNGPDTLSGAISLTNVITATGAGDIIVNSVPLTITSAVNKTYADGKLDKTTGGTVAGIVTFDNDLKVKGGSNYVTIRGHATSGNYNFVLPSSAGTAGYVLSTDGSGNTSWVTVGGGGAPSGAAGGDLSGTYPNPTITALDATKVGGGAVSNAEFSYLDGATSSIQTQLGTKEPAITAAATTTYFRGDKTFVTLNSTVVTEGTNLYFTNARALGIALTGFDNTLTGAVTASDTMLQAFGRVQNQINSISSAGSNYLIKNGPDTLSGAISLTNVITATGAGDIIVNSVPLTSTSAVNKNYADGKLDKTAGGTVAGIVTLDNDLKVKGGSNYVTVRGHATSANYNFILPSTAGTAGYVLSTDGSGNTSWVTTGGGGAPSGAAGGDLSGSYPNPTITALDAAKVGGGAVSNTEFSYLDGVTSAIQTQLNAKQATISKTTTQDVSKIRIYGANSTNYVELTAATLTGDRSLIFPDSNGTNGQALTTNGSGVLSWTTVGGAPSGAAGGDLSGTYPNPTITALDAAKVGGGAVSNTEYSYLDGVTSSIQTQLGTKEPAITGGSTAQYLRGDKSLATFATDVRATTLTGLSSTAGSVAATDTVLEAFGKMLNTQSDYVSKSGTTTVTGSFNIAGITAFLNIPTPSGATLTEAANVDYVLSFGQWTKSGSDTYRSGGNVSIGATPVTNTKLNVEGQIRSKSFSQATGAIDWANGNSGTTSFDCGSNVTFASIRDGGSYLLAVTGTGTTQCTFSTTTTGDDAATVTYRFMPANAVRTASSHTIYSMQRIGTIVYVSWITGY